MKILLVRLCLEGLNIFFFKRLNHELRLVNIEHSILAIQILIVNLYIVGVCVCALFEAYDSSCQKHFAFFLRRWVRFEDVFISYQEVRSHRIGLFKDFAMCVCVSCPWMNDFFKLSGGGLATWLALMPWRIIAIEPQQSKHSSKHELDLWMNEFTMNTHTHTHTFDASPSYSSSYHLRHKQNETFFVPKCACVLCGREKRPKPTNPIGILWFKWAKEKKNDDHTNFC